MKKIKKSKVLSIIALVLIVVLIVTATYAYFAAQTGEGSSTDINVTTATVDNLTFETGDIISINAYQSNFATGMNSLSDDTYAMATLVANNDTNSASANYYVYLNISTNEFEYTTSDSTAELILSITMDGLEVTSLDGYDYVSVTDGNSNVISGFDITTASGLIIIADNYLIESTGIEVDDWEVTITFVNLDSDQSGNAGKSFSASLIIQQEAMTLSNYILSLYSKDGVNSLYYFDGEGDYTNSDLEAVDYSYRYSGESYGFCTSDGNEVMSYENLDTSSVTETTCASSYKVTDTDGTLYYYDSTFADYYYNNPVSVTWNNDVCVTTTDSTQVYTEYGYDIAEEQCSGYAYQYADGSWYYLVTVEEVSGEWEGNSVDNYVCFGSDEETCPDDNLYRIIGLFLNDEGEYEIKLIKADNANSDLLGTVGDFYATESVSYSSYYINYLGNHTTISIYYWNKINYEDTVNDTGYGNVWSYSALNTVNLNTNYLNNIGEKWSNLITTHTWVVGGNTKENIYAGSTTNAFIAYTSEIINPVTTQGSPNLVASTYDAKVGLYYVSDYYYGASPTYWSYPGYTSSSNPDSDGNYGEDYDYRAAIDDNWLYIGLNEFTITRIQVTGNERAIARIDYKGNVNHAENYNPTVGNYNSSVRPTFYLNSSVAYSSGSGTIDDPIILQTS